MGWEVGSLSPNLNLDEPQGSWKWRAALMMSMAHKVLQDLSASPAVLSPAAILAEANVKMYPELVRAGMFATVFIGQYESLRKKLVYAKADHSPVIYAPYQGRAELFWADGTRLGVLPESQACDQEVDMNRGNLLVVATTGSVMLATGAGSALATSG